MNANECRDIGTRTLLMVRTNQRSKGAYTSDSLFAAQVNILCEIAAQLAEHNEITRKEADPLPLMIKAHIPSIIQAQAILRGFSMHNSEAARVAQDLEQLLAAIAE